jgi:hypothetical protein
MTPCDRMIFSKLIIIERNANCLSIGAHISQRHDVHLSRSLRVQAAIGGYDSPRSRCASRAVDSLATALAKTVHTLVVSKARAFEFLFVS